MKGAWDELGYYEILAEMIKKSGLTHKEIAEKCTEYGVTINKSYISKLLTRKQAPASDDVNEAIAKVCGGNVQEFLYEAYLEKAPNFIKDFINNIVKVTKDISISAIRSNNTEENLALIKTQFDSLSDIEFLNKISKFKENINELNLADFNLVDARKVGNSDEKKSEQSDQIIMKDESMEPTIPKGSVLQIDKNAKIKNGDIVLFLDKYNFQEEIRRYYSTNNEEDIIYESPTIIFTSDNPMFKPILADEQEDLFFLAKVVSITTTTKI